MHYCHIAPVETSHSFSITNFSLLTVHSRTIDATLNLVVSSFSGIMTDPIIADLFAEAENIEMSNIQHVHVLAHVQQSVYTHMMYRMCNIPV